MMRGYGPINCKTLIRMPSTLHLKLCCMYMSSSQVCKYDIEESIKREMSGDLKDGMLTIGMYMYSHDIMQLLLGDR